MVNNNSNLEPIAPKIYESNADEQIRRECEAREIHAILERRTQERLQELTEQNTTLHEQNAAKDKTIASLQAELARLKQEINKP